MGEATMQAAASCSICGTDSHILGDESHGAARREAEMSPRPSDVSAEELRILGPYAGTYQTRPITIDEAGEAIKELRKDRSIVKDLLRVEGTPR